MAKFLNNIDLNGNEIQNFVEQPLGTAPTTNVKVGRRFFDTSENRGKVYNGSSWLREAYMSDIAVLEGATGNIEERISALEAYFSTEEDADYLINKWNEIVEFLNASEGTTLDEILSQFATTESLDAWGEQLDERMGIVEGKIEDLEGASTDVTVEQTLTSGIEIGSITVDGKETKLYAPTAEEVDLSDYPKRYTTTITGDGSALTFTITHNLNTLFVSSTIYDASTSEQVIVDVVATNANSITLKFAVAPASTQSYRVIVIG